MSDKDHGNLMAILDSIRKVQLFITDVSDADALFMDAKCFDAVLMNFVVIGESVARLSEATRQRDEQIPWTQIELMRRGAFEAKRRYFVPHCGEKRSPIHRYGEAFQQKWGAKEQV